MNTSGSATSHPSARLFALARPEGVARRELALVAAALGAVGLHVVDDNFLQPQLARESHFHVGDMFRVRLPDGVEAEVRIGAVYRWSLALGGAGAAIVAGAVWRLPATQPGWHVVVPGELFALLLAGVGLLSVVAAVVPTLVALRRPVAG